MQRLSLRGRKTPVRGSIAARRAGVEAIWWACLACVTLLAASMEAATFDPVTGTLSAKAGSQPLVTKPVIIGSESALSQVNSPFAIGTASLNLQIPNSNRFNFDGGASSTTQALDLVQASYNFTQRFTTTAAQWMELTAKVNTDPFDNVEATASVTLGRVGQPVSFNVGYTSGRFETRAGAFAAGSFDLKSNVATTVTIGPDDRDAQTQGNLQIFTLADFNGSGTVDSVDLATWRGGFGMPSGTFANGNLDANAPVDGRDYLLWQRQFGAGVSALPVASAIPEPGTAFMALIGAAALGWRLARHALLYGGPPSRG